jgi:hypothetical protein
MTIAPNHLVTRACSPSTEAYLFHKRLFRGDLICRGDSGSSPNFARPSASSQVELSSWCCLSLANSRFLDSAGKFASESSCPARNDNYFWEAFNCWNFFDAGVRGSGASAGAWSSFIGIIRAMICFRSIRFTVLPASSHALSRRGCLNCRRSVMNGALILCISAERTSNLGGNAVRVVA